MRIASGAKKDIQPSIPLAWVATAKSVWACISELSVGGLTEKPLLIAAVQPVVIDVSARITSDHLMFTSSFLDAAARCPPFALSLQANRQHARAIVTTFTAL